MAVLQLSSKNAMHPRNSELRLVLKEIKYVRYRNAFLGHWHTFALQWLHEITT